MIFTGGKPYFVLNRDGTKYEADENGVLEAPEQYKDTLIAYGLTPEDEKSVKKTSKTSEDVKKTSKDVKKTSKDVNETSEEK